MSTYRRKPEEGRRCRDHPLAAATEICARCGADICDVCATFVASRVACPRCARPLALARAGKAAALVLGLLAAVVGAVAAFGRASAVDKGLPPATIPLEVELGRHPCQQGTILAILDELNRVHQYARTVERAARYRASSCPEFPRLLWREREALAGMGDHAGVVAVATRLVEETPHDIDPWWWRAESLAALGKLTDAALDYEQAIALDPSTNALPERLARVYERQGRPCDAALPLLLFGELRRGQTDAVHARERGLRLLGHCPTFAEGRGHLTVQDGRLQAKVTVPEGLSGVTGTFLVDRQTTANLVSWSFMAKVPRIEALGRARWVRTPDGLQKATLFWLPVIQVEGAKASGVTLAAVDTLPAGFDGVLGLSFSIRFQTSRSISGDQLDLLAP